jgi:hypothetical protein
MGEAGRAGDEQTHPVAGETASLGRELRLEHGGQ